MSRNKWVRTKLDLEALVTTVLASFFDADEKVLNKEFAAFTYPAGQEPIFGISKASLLKHPLWRKFNQTLEEKGLVWTTTRLDNTGGRSTLKIGVTLYEGLCQNKKEK